MQPAGLPGRTTGRGDATTSYALNRRGNSLSPQHLDYRHAGTRVKDALAPLTRPGCARSLTQLARLPEHRHLRGESESHEASQPCPANSSADAKLQAETPLDTGSLLQG